MPQSSVKKPAAGIVVIFGASGDLGGRKLAPAIYNLAREGLLPDRTAVVGYGRTAMSDDEFRKHMLQSVNAFSRSRPVKEKVWRSLSGRLFYQQGLYDRAEDFQALQKRLVQLDKRYAADGNRVYYLSVPPAVVVPILQNLTAAGSLERHTFCPAGRACYRRVVFEKPFGNDLESARGLNNIIEGLLDESQVFRMDHYLGKETVQNINVLRFANSIFEHVWHADSVSWIRVTVAEDIGVEDRGGYFDPSGITRDILQNHVLQLLTLIAMEPPVSLEADAIRDEKVKVLRCLRRLEGKEVARSAIRGQYTAGRMGRKCVRAYRDEEGVRPGSDTETFVGIRTYIDNWRWAGVPIYLCAGKRLEKKLCEVAVEFRDVPRVLFGRTDAFGLRPNRLTLRVQPDEGVALRFVSKVPGLKMELRNVDMDFPYTSAFPAASPEAYERLLLDVLAGHSALFTRRDEVEEAWDFTMGILDEWQKHAPRNFPNYLPGTWGPISTKDFFSQTNDYSKCPNPAKP